VLLLLLLFAGLGLGEAKALMALKNRVLPWTNHGDWKGVLSGETTLAVRCSEGDPPESGGSLGDEAITVYRAFGLDNLLDSVDLTV